MNGGTVALLYRAIWSEQRPDLLEVGAATFGLWAESKNLHMTIPEEGVVSAGAEEIAVTRAADDSVRALRIRLSHDLS